MSSTIPDSSDASTLQSDIHLTTLTSSPQDPEATQSHLSISSSNPQEFSSQTTNLPSIDGGQQAWRLLLAAFIFEALLWGFPLSFGVFQAHYSSLPTFQHSVFLSAIGTTASGISYLGAPLITPFIQRHARYRVHMICIGWPLCIVGLVAGSFCSTAGGLLGTQGVIYGVGFVIFYYPILSMVDEFWVRRRGFAYGLLCSASGASGAVAPVAIQTCLDRWGYKNTLRGVAVLLVATTGPLIPLLKGRGEARSSVRLKTDWSFLRSRRFWTYSVSNAAMGMGYFFPALFLPSFAQSIGLSAVKGALLLTIMSIAQVAGQLSFGHVSDIRRVPLDVLIMASAVVAALVTLTAWGLARSFFTLALFAVLYGFFGAGYTAMWARMVTAVSEEPSASQAMFGLFCAGKGIGNILTGPISAGLLRWTNRSASYGHGMYQAVIVFTGVCLMTSAGSLGLMYTKKSCFR